MSYIGAQQKVLSGRGTVGRFDEGTSAGKYFYRERITVNGKRKYCYRLLEGVKSLEEAVAIAPEAAIALASEQARTSAPKHAEGQEKLHTRNSEAAHGSIPVEQAIKEFLRHHSLRRDAEVITENTFENKRGILENHLARYLKFKKVFLTVQISEQNLTST